ncbi:reverse transcriptase domain-containing protein [Tanacetum coccineum]
MGMILYQRFIKQFLSSLKNAKILRNEITRSQQRFDESFTEAWDRFNDLLRACPHHGFSELHQLDTFYNALNANDQDSLNSAAGGNFLDKMPRECLKIIESKSKVRNSRTSGNFLDKMPRECLRIIESKSKVRNSRNKLIVAKVSSNSSTPRISPDVVALTTEVSELKNMMKTMLINKQKAQAAAANFNSTFIETTFKSMFHKLLQLILIKEIPIPDLRWLQTKSNLLEITSTKDKFTNLRLVNHQFTKLNLINLLLSKCKVFQRPIFENCVKANDVVLRNMQNQGQGLQNQMTNLTEMFSKFVNSNTASSLSSGSLPSNTVTNPKEDLKGITTQSGVVYQGPTTTTSSPKVVERRTEVTKDMVFPTNNGITEDVQPSVVPVENQNPVSKPVDALVSASMSNLKPSIPYPSRRNDDKHHENANEQKEKFYKIFKDMSFENSFMDALTLMPKFASTLKALIRNKEKLSEMVRTPLNEHYSTVILNKLPKKLGDPGRFLIPCKFPEMDECLALADLGASINLMPFPESSRIFRHDRQWQIPLSGYDPIVFKFIFDSHGPFGIVIFLLLKKLESFLALSDDPTSTEVDEILLMTRRDILILEALLNSDPSPPPNQGNYLPEIRKELKLCEAKTAKSSIDEPPEVELKDLPPHLEYAFLEDNNKLPVIIAKDLSVDEKTALIKVLKSRKQAIAWKLSDIKGINPEFCSHKILMEEDYEPAVQHQRRVNPKIHDVIKKEVEKLLDAGLIYPISDSPWVSPVHYVPKKGGMTVVTNDENELVPTRLVTGWRVCIDYRKLNAATRKDHFPFSFMDQMLERLANVAIRCEVLVYAMHQARSRGV